MAKVLLIGPDDEEQQRLLQELRRNEHACSLQEDVEEALSEIEMEAPDVVLVNLARPVFAQRELREVLQACGGNARIPVIGLLGDELLAEYDVSQGFDDFQLYPCRPLELVTRVRQALWHAGKMPREDQNVLSCGDLVIDTNRYEVFLAGRPVEVTFKEYELLRFLASNPDRVFTREALLNRVWGYDYYGGARTVDVHIRRLRSKIEDRDHLFIETVRNVGYRFRPSNPVA